MNVGTVIRFNKIKGYGFIKPDDSESEIFVHFSEIQLSGYRELKVGQRIHFVSLNGEKGIYATQVSLID